MCSIFYYKYIGKAMWENALCVKESIFEFIPDLITREESTVL